MTIHHVSKMKHYDDLPRAIRDELKYCSTNWLTEQIYAAWRSGMYNEKDMVRTIRNRNMIEDGKMVSGITD